MRVLLVAALVVIAPLVEAGGPFPPGPDGCVPPSRMYGCPYGCSQVLAKARIYEGAPAEYQLERLGGMPTLELRERPVVLELVFSGALGAGLLALLLALTVRRPLKVGQLPTARRVSGPG